MSDTKLQQEIQKMQVEVSQVEKAITTVAFDILEASITLDIFELVDALENLALAVALLITDRVSCSPCSQIRFPCLS